METELTPEMMASFLPGKQHVPYSSPTQVAHYASIKPNEYNEVAYPDGPILKTHKPESLNRLHPGEDPLEYIMDNAVELDTLYKLKNSLRKVESRMTDEGKLENLSSLSVFDHVLKYVVTERMRDLY